MPKEAPMGPGKIKEEIQGWVKTSIWRPSKLRPWLRKWTPEQKPTYPTGQVLSKENLKD